MNPLKRRYRFIDLLKPETGAVVPLLLALEPKLDIGFRTLLKAAPLVRDGVLRRAYDDDGMPIDAGELGGVGGANAKPVTLDEILREELGADAALFAGEAKLDDGELGGVADVWARLKAMAAQLREVVDAAATLRGIKSAKSDDIRRKRLIAALNHTAKKDRSFDPKLEIAAYTKPATTLCKRGGFEVVVFGHTHLPKQIDLSKKEVGHDATYLNTGTWASVIRLDTLPQPIEESFIDAVADNKLDAYIKRYLTYAEITLDGDAVRDKAIRSFCGKERPREAPLTAAP
jgi:hypothetical protein